MLLQVFCQHKAKVLEEGYEGGTDNCERELAGN